MRDKIVIYKETRTSDGTGGFTSSKTLDKVIFANVTPENVKYKDNSGVQTYLNGVKIVTYSKNWTYTGIDGLHVEWNSTQYKITRVSNVGFYVIINAVNER
jgi:hypothetical protein